MIYWFTGQPGAGKTTLALALKSELKKAGHAVVHLDGEFIRDLMANKDFSEAGRMRNVTAGQQLALKLHSEGLIVVASFVSPYRTIREDLKRNPDVAEIYVHTTAIRGKEAYFAANFEPPLKNFVDMDTTNALVGACVQQILKLRPLPATG